MAKIKKIGINWHLRYQLEKGRAEILQMKVEILRKRLAKYENYNIRAPRDRKDDNVIKFSRSIHTTGN